MSWNLHVLAPVRPDEEEIRALARGSGAVVGEWDGNTLDVDAALVSGPYEAEAVWSSLPLSTGKPQWEVLLNSPAIAAPTRDRLFLAALAVADRYGGAIYDPQHDAVVWPEGVDWEMPAVEDDEDALSQMPVDALWWFTADEDAAKADRRLAEWGARSTVDRADESEVPPRAKPVARVRTSVQRSDAEGKETRERFREVARLGALYGVVGSGAPVGLGPVTNRWVGLPPVGGDFEWFGGVYAQIVAPALSRRRDRGASRRHSPGGHARQGSSERIRLARARLGTLR